MPCAPVIITQRAGESAAECSASVSLIASRMGWSSALRLAGLEIVRRTTPSAGSSSSSLPSASSRAGAGADTAGRLVEHDEGVALVDRLALLAADLHDGARVFGLDGHLHLHRLEDRDRVALLDAVADRALDFPYRAGDMSLD